MPDILNQYTGLMISVLLLLALVLFIIVILLLIRLRRTQDSAENAEENVNRVLRHMLDRRDYQQQNESTAMRLMQVMDERSRDEAVRMDAVSRQMDTFSKNQEDRLERITASLDEKLRQNEARMESMRRTMAESISALQQDNAAKLEQMRKTVDERLQSTLETRLTASFSLVNERLEQVYKGLGEMQALANGVGDLKKMLSNVKTRGIWGEIQLGKLLSDTLSPEQYAENVAVVPDSTLRVEYAIRLPGQGGQPVWLPIDSKFPIESYSRLQDAAQRADTAALPALRRDFENALRTEAKRISDKYISPPCTTDFAVMFLPLEGLYAEALRFPGLLEETQSRFRVMMTGPSTFAALLTSLQVGFRTVVIEQRTREIWQLLSAVKTDFAMFSQLLDTTQKRLQSAADSIETASRKTRTIERRLRDVESMDTASAVRLLQETEPDDAAGCKQ